MGQVHFENFDFLVKVKSPLGQSIFSFPFSYLIFFFFFLQAVRTGSGFQVGPGQTGYLRMTSSVTSYHYARVSTHGTWRVGARVMMNVAPSARVSA